MTTLDVYSFVSYAFVLLAMTEYALVLIIVEKGAKEANQEYGLGEQVGHLKHCTFLSKDLCVSVYRKRSP